MKVSLAQNPLHPEGFAASFPFDWASVERLKLCLGYAWNKSRKQWESPGPEVLLDMGRFGIEVDKATPHAVAMSQAFYQQLDQVMQVRKEDIEEDEYAYQIQGTKVLASIPNIILADDLGLGKSKQALDAAVLIGAKRILVLCPKTLCFNWLQEVAKWHPEISVGVLPDHRKFHNRLGNGRDEFWRDEHPRIVISNYEKVLLNDWPIDIDWDVLICDEATKLKNSQTLTYKTVKRIVKHTTHTWALTGTPMEKRIPELYNIVCLLRPAVFGSYMRFAEQHCITDWSGNVVGAKNLELLRDRLGPFMLRRTKKEVLKQLPEKLPPINHFVTFNHEEKNAYESMTAEFNNWLDEHGISGGGDPLVQTVRMRQFCCSPAIWGEDLLQGSKFAALQEIIEDWPDKLVIFCYFKEMTRLLQKWLKSNPEAYIDGDVKDRIDRVNRFNNGELGNIFISTDAGAYGVNLVGANLIIHYDQGFFNPMKMRQREDRLHRIGQKSTVSVINLMYVDSIDYGIYQLNLEEAGLFEDVIEGAEIALLKKLDAPRLKRLIQGRLNG